MIDYVAEFVAVLVGVVIGVGVYRKRYRFVRWFRWRRSQRSEPLYLLRVRQPTPLGVYSVVVPFPDADDPLIVAAVAKSADVSVALETGLVTPEREWSVSREIPRP